MARPKVLTPAQARRLAEGKAPDITEAEWQAQVLQLAEQFGWHLHDRTIPDDPEFVLPGIAWHPTLAKWSMRGWPDLTLVRVRPRTPLRLGDMTIVFAELKSRIGKLTARQAQVMALLGNLRGTWLSERPPGEYRYLRVEVEVWRPEDVRRVAEVLR